MTILHRTALFLAAAAVAFSQVSPGTANDKLPEGARTLKLNYGQAVERVAKPLREKYHAALNQLLEKSMRTVRPEEAQALKDEIMGVPPTRESLKLPEAGERLRKNYQQDMARGVGSLRKKYIDELNRMAEQSARAGKLEEVTTVKDEITKEANAEFEQKLVTGSWLWNNGFPIRFTPEGKATNDQYFSWKTVGPYTIDYTWGPHSGTIVFDQNMGKAVITEKFKEKKAALVLTRIKE